MNENTKVINTDDLLAASERSARLFGKIRALTVPKGMTLDPDGLHIVGTHIGQEENVRCEMYCKMVGSDDPVRTWIDMEYETFNSLPTLGDVQKLRGAA